MLDDTDIPNYAIVPDHDDNKENDEPNIEIFTIAPTIVSNDLETVTYKQKYPDSVAVCKNPGTRAAALLVLNKHDIQGIPKLVEFKTIKETNTGELKRILKIEKIPGIDLKIYMDLHGAFSISDTLNILLQLTKIATDMLDIGVIHNDIKPSNIIYNPQNKKITLVDFGSATTDTLSKPQNSTKFYSGITYRSSYRNQPTSDTRYISPERAHGTKMYYGRNEIFSIAATGLALLTDRQIRSLELIDMNPENTMSNTEQVNEILNIFATNPVYLKETAISEKLLSILFSNLRKQPEDRQHQTLKEFYISLQALKVLGNLLSSYDV